MKEAIDLPDTNLNIFASADVIAFLIPTTALVSSEIFILVAAIEWTHVCFIPFSLHRRLKGKQLADFH